MRTQSIIPDPEPYSPTVEKQVKKPEPTDWEKLANGSDYKVVRSYLEGRIAYFQRFLPGGQSIADLTDAERVEAWGHATVIINEFEGLLKTLEAHKHRG